MRHVLLSAALVAFSVPAPAQSSANDPVGALIAKMTIEEKAAQLQDMRLIEAILTSVKNGGAPVRTDWGYRRAIDPAVAVSA